MKINGVVVGACALAFAVFGGAYSQEPKAQQSEKQSDSGSSAFDLYVDSKGDISLPKDFAINWSHLGSWAIEKEGTVEGFHNVYAPKSVVDYFRKNGKFADGAILVKELRKARGAAHTTGNAFWAVETEVWFIMVKDTVGRYTNNPLWGDGWGWALYEAKNPSEQVATDYKKDCLGCHIPAKNTDWTYVYAYPTLGPEVAKFAPKKTDAARMAADAMTEIAAVSGDAVAGEKVFDRCRACHSLTPGKHGLGPSLSDVVDREAGSAKGFNYSKAMRDSDVIWTAETLDSHLSDVKGFIPGNRMATFFPIGVQNAQERASVIAYLLEASAQQ